MLAIQKRKQNAIINAKAQKMKYLEHLKDIKDEILYKTLEEQAVYADFVCVDNIKNLDFIKDQLDGINVNDATMYQGFNTTSIGNLAFIALNAPSVYADKAKLILSNYKLFIELGKKAQNMKRILLNIGVRFLNSIGFLIILIGLMLLLIPSIIYWLLTGISLIDKYLNYVDGLGIKEIPKNC